MAAHGTVTGNGVSSTVADSSVVGPFTRSVIRSDVVASSSPS